MSPTTLNHWASAFTPALNYSYNRSLNVIGWLVEIIMRRLFQTLITEYRGTGLRVETWGDSTSSCSVLEWVVIYRLWKESIWLGLSVKVCHPSIYLIFKIYYLVWVKQCSGKRIISTFCFCWLICKNREIHILLNNTHNLHLKFICLVPGSPTEQNVCNKYSCVGDIFALEETKSWSLVQ